MDDMYVEFFNVANQLNNQLKIVPLLYGSLGLQKITDVDFYPDDIDILIPKIFLKSKWSSLKGTIEELGYELIDLHEHEFIKGKYKIAFADIESLVPFAGMDFGNIENKSQNGIKYKILKWKIT